MIYFEEEKRKIAIKEKEMLYHTVLCRVVCLGARKFFIE